MGYHMQLSILALMLLQPHPCNTDSQCVIYSCNVQVSRQAQYVAAGTPTLLLAQCHNTNCNISLQHNHEPISTLRTTEYSLQLLVVCPNRLQFWHGDQ